MTLTEDRVVLGEHPAVEDAETLLAHLRRHPGVVVDMAACRHAHGAVLQVLLALRPPIGTPPADAWLATVLARRAEDEAP